MFNRLRKNHLNKKLLVTYDTEGGEGD